jgi:hypothetical protein
LMKPGQVTAHHFVLLAVLLNFSEGQIFSIKPVTLLLATCACTSYRSYQQFPVL